MRTVFFGSPAFSLPALQMMAESPYRPGVVVTRPDSLQGRGLRAQATPVRVLAQKLAISTLTPVSLEEPTFLDTLRKFNPDLFVVVAFLILPATLLALPGKGSVNLHPSLLPQYRGAAPIERAILAGERASGLSIFRLEEKVDQGPILAQAAFAIGPEETAGELRQRLACEGAKMLLCLLPLLEAGGLQGIPQEPTLASRAPKIREQDAIILWPESALTVHNRIRAMNPNPGAFTWIPGKRGPLRLSIWRSRLAPFSDLEVGEVRLESNRLSVGCGQGSIWVEELQLEGRKRLAIGEFLLGYRLQYGERWGSY
ncbi:MAG: methionyl-tRNA formyltransferase [Coprothermobacterota bacterium]|nr:methionyl-tRNA formyltransferase [Coprothermobacterota bacterium]